MRKYEKMIEGVGFLFDPQCPDANFNHVPSYEECRAMVAERAYEKWEQSGHPRDNNHDWDRWLAAERELFRGFVEGGYDIFVCDMSQKENKGFFRHYDIVHVDQSGVKKVGPRGFRKQ